MIEAGTGWNVRGIRRPDGEDEAEGDAMATATWNYDENEVIAAAKQLGIELTNAELGSELCEVWADRVLQAKKHYDDVDMEGCQEMIEDANAYAV